MWLSSLILFIFTKTNLESRIGPILPHKLREDIHISVWRPEVWKQVIFKQLGFPVKDEGLNTLKW